MEIPEISGKKLIVENLGKTRKFDPPHSSENLWPTLTQCFISISPENVRKPKGF